MILSLYYTQAFFVAIFHDHMKLIKHYTNNSKLKLQHQNKAKLRQASF